MNLFSYKKNVILDSVGYGKLIRANDCCNFFRPKNIYKDPDDGRQRFLLELEFVQCLANPTYIHCMVFTLSICFQSFSFIRQ